MCFCSIRKKFSSHLFSYVNNRDERSTTTEVNRCPLLPGGLGQLVAQALSLDEGQPYLLLWAHHAIVSGGPPVKVRAVLASLGFVPSTFRWWRAPPERSLVHPVSTESYSAVFVLLCNLFTDLLYLGSREICWSWLWGQWAAPGPGVPQLWPRQGWLEVGLGEGRQCPG